MAGMMNKVVERSPEAKRARARSQQVMAAAWQGGKHLTDLAKEHGIAIAEAEKEVAWGLLRMGEVQVVDLVAWGYHTPTTREARA